MVNEPSDKTNQTNGRHKPGIGEPAHRKEIDGIEIGLYKKLMSEIGPPSRKKIKINARLAINMHNAGWSYRQIGQHFGGISGYTVRRRINESKLMK